VEKLPWGNTIQVTQGVEKALDEMAPGLTGITVDPNIFQAASFVTTALSDLDKTLYIGIVLVLIVLECSCSSGAAH